ncbi:hypothetical protein C3489_02370 [Streptomyces sp. Ru71]|uniref:SAV_2336 N-terminal domain-related protein n=1 Tax=Streptomyces sp. Ru71 TaxID=2080746 RepID=UPI000CDD614C|nr:SAV_2336 N-terminal domain-related protein [Streptomyces sp. Ru71]POX57111.1 hypothetical protein C3489_02370 [Streptomyces sp. Ru71]
MSEGTGDGILREELARLLDAGGAPDAGDALDVLWIARLSGLDPLDWSLLGDAAASPAGPRPDIPPPPPATPDPHPGRDDAPRTPSTQLHLPGAAGGTGHHRPGRGHTVRVAQPAALPEPLRLTRALRPLRQTVPSVRARTLDVAATAAASAETELLLPVLRPAAERRFGVDLLVDTGTTMTVWHRLARELHGLLARHGAFAHVRAWALGTDGPEPTLAPFRRGTSRPAAPTRRWRQTLADPTNRRVVLVLTDGVGPAWYGTELAETLADWSRRRPVAVLQVLPSRLWHRTALRPAPVRARSTETTRATLEYRSSGPLPGVPRGSAGAEARAAIRWLPVLELSADWIAPWSRLVSGRTTDWTPLSAAPLTVVDRPAPPAATDEPAAPAVLVERFEEGYSPDAYRLLRLLAAAPLSLPVMRLVQRTMLPSSTPMHLAEVFLSGLLVRRTPPRPGEDPEEVVYDFRDGVRGALLDRLTRTESLRVLGEVVDGVSDRVTATLGGVNDFAALAAVAGTGVGADGRELPAESLAFAEVAVEVIGGIGGDHDKVAAKLGLGGAPARGVPGPEGRRERQRGTGLFSRFRRRRRQDEEERGALTEDGGRVVDSRIPPPPPVQLSRTEAITVVQRLLDEALSDRWRDNTATCVIEGPPGSGKTVMAADVARRLRGAFGTVRWIDAHSRRSLLEGLGALAEDLGLGRGRKGDLSSLPLDRLFDYLCDHPDWLLIYDGVTQDTYLPDPYHPDGPPLVWLPPDYGSLLVTVADGTHWVDDEATTVRIDGFSRADAALYLYRSLAARRGTLWNDEQQLRVLVDAVGTMPRDLADAVSRIEGQSVDVGSYTFALMAKRTRLDRITPSLVWLTVGDQVVGTGVAVRRNLVLTTESSTGSGPLQVRSAGLGRGVRGTLGRHSNGLLALQVAEAVLQPADISPPEDSPVVAVWHTSGEARIAPELVLYPAGEGGTPPPGPAALVDAEGRLHSLVGVGGEGRTEHVITPDLVDAMVHDLDTFVSALSEREPSDAPLFFLSYAHSGSDDMVRRFLRDLNERVRRLAPGSAPGVALEGMAHGASWETELRRRLASARVLVPLFSSRYFRSEWCGREWDAFERRSTGPFLAVVPVLWEPPDRMPARMRDHRLLPGPTSEGLRTLMRTDPEEYGRALDEIAEHVLAVAHQTSLVPCDPALLDDLRNAFADERP